MKKVKSIHFVGIKGVGMTPLAIIAKEAGIAVTGSDIEEDFITSEGLKRAKVVPFVGFSKENVGDVDLVIVSGAHDGFDNVEAQVARGRGIRVISQGEAVGLFMQGEIFGKKVEGVSVLGSHGKTTTTAMIATVLKDAGLDPSYVIGTGDIPSLGSPGHFGRGKYFVAEADEYVTEPKYDKTIKFLWQHPKLAVFTNIEFDHPDIYDSIDKVRNGFAAFANSLFKDGILIANGDDMETGELLKELEDVKFLTYGLSSKNDFFAERLSFSGEKTFFWVTARGTSLGEFSINVSGTHNVLNALASIASCVELGLPVEKIKSGLSNFVGSKRRFEYVGQLKSGALAFDDYAHHPTEIKKTLEAFRKRFPKKKIVCIFQPHTYSRTKSLFEQFKTSFSDANTVILANIYPSLREKPDPHVSSERLAQEIAKVRSDVIFLPKLSDVVEYIDKIQPDRGTILVSMGAGDIYKIWTSLL